VIGPLQEPLYRTEAALVRDLLQHLDDGGATARAEFDYTSGRSDVVLLGDGDEVLAIEAKLTRWREALHQAYRNRCFAHRSYVALPPEVAARAGRYASEFALRRVGIYAVSPHGLTLILECEHEAPVLPWLTATALTLLREGAA
jgi:hypothetical protein